MVPSEPATPTWGGLMDWLGGYRRLSEDDERLTESSESLIHPSMSRLILNRLCRA